MTSPVRSLALAPAQPTRRGWVGLSLSILCFLHCVGAAALVPLLPAAFSVLTENELVEWSLLAISAVLAGRSAWTQPRVSRGGWVGGLVAWAAVTVLGVASLLLESEGLLQAALAGLALLQVWMLLGRRRSCPY
jgi:hypothetical protein